MLRGDSQCKWTSAHCGGPGKLFNNFQVSNCRASPHCEAVNGSVLTFGCAVCHLAGSGAHQLRLYAGFYVTFAQIDLGSCQFNLLSFVESVTNSNRLALFVESL